MHFSTHFRTRHLTTIRTLLLGAFLVLSNFLTAQVVLHTQNNITSENLMQLDILAENFDDIAAMQFTINWDPAVLSFTRIAIDSTDLQLNNGNFNTNIVEQGKLPVAWITSGLSSVSVADDTPIITLFFEVFSNTPTEIFFNGDPTPIEFVNANGEILTVTSSTNMIEFQGQLVEGRIFSDTQMDCIYQENEVGLNSWMVEFHDGERSRFTRTDANGQFRVYLLPNTYTVRPVLPENGYWTLCEFEKSLTVTEEVTEPSPVSFGAIAVVDCPSMKVDVSTAFLRRCFENIYRVEYCNQGTASAEDVHIVLNLPAELSIVSSPVPYTNLGNGDFQFDIGAVQFNTCSGFALLVKLDCESTELGQTHCVEATIFPQDLCNTSSELWSGASLDIKSSCDGDSVRFDIENVGEEDMDNPLPFIVIQDMIMLRRDQTPVQLSSGEKTSINLPANGATYRMEMVQIANHPTSNKVSAAIEGCGVNEQGTTSRGFINMFEMDDESAFTDIDCQENIGAFDPNDKTGYPIGYGDQHFIDQNIRLTYHIRFQNTGTDTAFNVVVVDTLTEYLDVSSLELLSASHEYSLEILEENILQFSFNDILLVDSFKNEPLSHGYIRFEIDQQVDVPLETVIKNSAAIYFDFNKPIITNVTEHTLGKEFIEIEVRTSTFETPLMKMDVYPNPFAESTMVTIEELNGKEHSFFLYDLNGRLVKQYDFTGNQFQLMRKDLLSGVYLFKVLSEGRLMGNGKLSIR